MDTSPCRNIGRNIFILSEIIYNVVFYLSCEKSVNLNYFDFQTYAPDIGKKSNVKPKFVKYLN